MMMMMIYCGNYHPYTNTSSSVDIRPSLGFLMTGIHHMYTHIYLYMVYYIGRHVRDFLPTELRWKWKQRKWKVSWTACMLPCQYQETRKFDHPVYQVSIDVDTALQVQIASKLFFSSRHCTVDSVIYVLKNCTVCFYLIETCNRIQDAESCILS